MMLKFLLEKEFKQIRRNKFLPRLIIVFPFVALWLLPLAANFEVKNVRVSVVDNSHSGYAKRLVNKVVSSGYFKLVNSCPDYRMALRDVELDVADIVLEIPPQFEENLVREQAATVLISANTVNGTRGGLGSAYLAMVISDFASEVRTEWIPTPGKLQVPAFQIVPQYRYNPHLRYPIFMVPALMVMLLTIICGFLPALNIVSEKETGTMEQINVTPVKRSTFILSKLLPYWIIGFVVFSICMFVARLFYGLIPQGSLLTIYLFASVFVLAISGLGLVISNVAKSIQQAMFLMFFFVMTCIFLSGLYTPVASMPDWAQTISTFSPLKYFIQVMRLGYLKGSGFSDLITHFFALCAFALFFNALAVITYKKSS
jgi:ABC-2 type transport system permease protein